MDIQLGIVMLIVAAAIAYIGFSFYKKTKSNACESGACGCNPSKSTAK